MIGAPVVLERIRPRRAASVAPSVFGWIAEARVGLPRAPRGRDLRVTAIAASVGIASGIVVSAMQAVERTMHKALFGLGGAQRLSTAQVAPLRLVAVLAAGGVAVALLSLWAGARFRERLADAIEANALDGGRMSFQGSLLITAQTFLSNGFGASVGLEAAFTQICAALSSATGYRLGLGRLEMRLLVASGAAGAISAAFVAPFTGCFYAFELILGSYSIGSLMPIATSALLATLVAGRVGSEGGGPPTGEVLAHLGSSSLPVAALMLVLTFAALAALAAAGSVLMMKAVAAIEGACDRACLPHWSRPVLGGICVSLVGACLPQVLGAGHGAFEEVLAGHVALATLVGVVLCKALASALTLGCGFRGGLFFASLLIGAAAGRVCGEIASLLQPSAAVDLSATTILGMAAMGTGVLGAPITMTCLALEKSGDLGVAVAALAICSATSLLVRSSFGYNFATWRFHLRGQEIRGPQDVGWQRDLLVGRIASAAAPSLPHSCLVAEVCALLPDGWSGEAIVVDDRGRYAGMVRAKDLHEPSSPAIGLVSALALAADAFLLPTTSVREALDLFEVAGMCALAVIDSPDRREVVGRLTEIDALRHYRKELEGRVREHAVA